jgi:hypothetical protein
VRIRYEPEKPCPPIKLLVNVDGNTECARRVRLDACLGQDLATEGPATIIFPINVPSFCICQYNNERIEIVFVITDLAVYVEMEG